MSAAIFVARRVDAEVTQNEDSHRVRLVIEGNQVIEGAENHESTCECYLELTPSTLQDLITTLEGLSLDLMNKSIGIN